MQNGLVKEGFYDAEAARPSGESGIWITDKGEILDCDYAMDRHHSDVALDHIEFPEGGDGIIDSALRLGWIRIRQSGDMMSIQLLPKIATPAALKVLRQCDEPGTTVYFVECGDFNGYRYPTFRQAMATISAVRAREPITEGLIPVPPRMFRTVMGWYRKELLWWARDQLRGKAKEMPEHAREFRALVKQYVPGGLPTERYGSVEEKPIRVATFYLKLDDLPDQYAELEAVTDRYRVVIDWRKGGNSKGGWHPSKHYVVINPMNFGDWVGRYPARRNQETLTYVIKEIAATLEHELRHAVQSLLLEPKAPEQSRRHKGYKDMDISKPETLSDYYTSPVEFDPTIGSCAANFVKHVEMLREYGKKIDMGSAIRKFVGMKKTQFFDQFATDPFFMVLRKKAPKKYAIAVKKFIGEVERMLEPQNESLTESAQVIPETTYGYWISPEGKIVPVPLFSHGRVIRAFGFSDYLDAVDAGWIRVVAVPVRDNPGMAGQLAIQLYPARVNSRAISALRRIAKANVFTSNPGYWLSSDGPGVSRVEDFNKGFAEESAFFAAIQRAKAVSAEKAELVEEVDYPTTSYGYWINPQGETFAVPHCNHDGIIWQLHQQGQAPESKGKAVAAGWVRIVADGYFACQFSTSKLTARAKAMVQRLASANAYRAFYLDVEGVPYNSAFRMLSDKTIHGVDEFMKLVNRGNLWSREENDPQPRVMAEGILCEANIPPTDYGYWITGDGEFIPVPYQSHVDCIPGNWDFNTAYEHGWIRIVVVKDELFVKCKPGTLTTRGILSLRALARGFQMFFFDTTTGRKDIDSKAFMSIGTMVAFAQTLKATNPITETLLELYQETGDSTFTHDGKQYDLNALLRELDDAETHDIPLDALEWVLDWDDADPERLEKADVTAPIIVTWWMDEDADTHRLVVIDGLHRVKKALEQGMEYIPGHYVDADELSSALR